jgi:hypothetical protein
MCSSQVVTDLDVYISIVNMKTSVYILADFTIQAQGFGGSFFFMLTTACTGRLIIMAGQ